MRKALLLSLVAIIGIVLGRGKLPNELEITSYDRDFYEILKEPVTVDTARPSIWPVVGVITSDFGWRWRRRKYHSGIDIAAPYGSEVVATAPGYVLFAGWLRGYGYTVILYHGFGYSTLYAHMASVSVRTGEEVSRGRVVGYVGTSGRTTGPHLHYEVIKYGIRQDPILYLP